MGFAALLCEQSCYCEALFTSNRFDLLDPFFDCIRPCSEPVRLPLSSNGQPGNVHTGTVYSDRVEKLPDDVAAEMRELYLIRIPLEERSERLSSYSETKHPHWSRWN